MFKYTCQLCGREFESPSGRAKYCIYCRDKAQAKRNEAYKEKKEAGLSVAVGSEQICPVCSKPYIVTSGSQKYCKDCTKKQTQSKKKSPSSSYINSNYDYIRFNVPKGELESVKEYARSRGMTVKELMLTALEEYKKNHDK